MLATLAGECQANQAAPETRHEVDGLRRHVVGSEYQVTFVFAVFFVYQNHHATGTHVLHNILQG